MSIVAVLSMTQSAGQNTSYVARAWRTEARGSAPRRAFAHLPFLPSFGTKHVILPEVVEVAVRLGGTPCTRMAAQRGIEAGRADLAQPAIHLLGVGRHELALIRDLPARGRPRAENPGEDGAGESDACHPSHSFGRGPIGTRAGPSGTVTRRHIRQP